VIKTSKFEVESPDLNVRIAGLTALSAQCCVCVCCAGDARCDTIVTVSGSG
jgi:hypothetical protein